MTVKSVVTRFAPSPTGALHIGVRTALFNWAYARQHQGQFIVRLEDTDQARSSIESARRIIAELRWLEVDWDQGPRCVENWRDALAKDFDPMADQVGNCGPYCQSQRLQIYEQYLDQLLTSGHAYHDDGAIRFRMDQDVKFDDTVYGHIEVKAKELEDFVIRKADGFPTYHLAVVVDDALMAVTHVIRGQEHLTNTTKHVALQDALGFDRPTFVHTPSVLNADGSKMSKRDKAKVARKALKEHCPEEEELMAWAITESAIVPQELLAFYRKKNDSADIAQILAHPQWLDLMLPEIDVADFRHSGYLSQTLVNYMVLLGWNPGGDIERFDREFLIERFSLDRINKSNAKFDRKKLLAFNQESIAGLEHDDFKDRLRVFKDQELSDDLREQFGSIFSDDQRLTLFAQAYHRRASTLKDPFELGSFLTVDGPPLEYDQKAVEKVLNHKKGQGYGVLEEIHKVLKEVGDDQWNAEELESLLKNVSDDLQLSMRFVAQPLRVAISGSTVSPPIGITLEIVGREIALRCIEVCQHLQPG